MPHDSPETKAGPSKAGTVFHVSDGSGKKGTDVDVRIRQPSLLRARSLGLRREMDKKHTSSEIPLKIEPSTDIDRDAVVWVLENLQKQNPDENPDPKGLARHCAVLWKYECLPDPFRGLADSMQPRSSSGSVSSADQQSSIALNGSPSGASRCWQGKKKVHTCRHLITIAIVLGFQEILEEEIKTAVWGTEKKIDIIVPLGLDIETIRKHELGKLFRLVYEEITEINDADEKLAKSIREILKQHNLGNFAKTWKKNEKELERWTPYEFLLGVENAFSPPELQVQEPELQATVGVRDFRSIPWERLSQRIFQKVMHINGIEVNGQERKEAIIDGLATLVHERGHELAEKLMRQRNSIIQEWRNSLSS
ncbi:hypothetical protein N431DRAFT_376541 [Stipitochalara longipes BDJ]|nr:hypothetical protein N431DRAFT_376541 [Stipitochalara longipes BDJ]